MKKKEKLKDASGINNQFPDIGSNLRTSSIESPTKVAGQYGVDVWGHGMLWYHVDFCSQYSVYNNPNMGMIRVDDYYWKNGSLHFLGSKIIVSGGFWQFGGIGFEDRYCYIQSLPFPNKTISVQINAI